MMTSASGAVVVPPNMTPMAEILVPADYDVDNATCFSGVTDASHHYNPTNTASSSSNASTSSASTNIQKKDLQHTLTQTHLVIGQQSSTGTNHKQSSSSKLLVNNISHVVGQTKKKEFEVPSSPKSRGSGYFSTTSSYEEHSYVSIQDCCNNNNTDTTISSCKNDALSTTTDQPSIMSTGSSSVKALRLALEQKANAANVSAANTTTNLDAFYMQQRRYTQETQRRKSETMQNLHSYRKAFPFSDVAANQSGVATSTGINTTTTSGTHTLIGTMKSMEEEEEGTTRMVHCVSPDRDNSASNGVVVLESRLPVTTAVIESPDNANHSLQYSPDRLPPSDSTESLEEPVSPPVPITYRNHAPRHNGTMVFPHDYANADVLSVASSKNSNEEFFRELQREQERKNKQNILEKLQCCLFPWSSTDENKRQQAFSKSYHHKSTSDYESDDDIGKEDDTVRTSVMTYNSSSNTQQQQPGNIMPRTNSNGSSNASMTSKNEMLSYSVIV